MRFFILPSITVFLGMFFAAWNYDFFYIIAHPIMKKNFFLHEITRTEKKITFFTLSQKQEKLMLAYPLIIPWDNKNQTKNTEQIVQKWLFLQQESGLIKKNISLEAIIMHAPSNTLYLSFSHCFLKKSWSLFFTISFLQSLIKSLSPVISQIRNIQILINHLPHEHDLLDLSEPLACSIFQ